MVIMLSSGVSYQNVENMRRLATTRDKPSSSGVSHERRSGIKTKSLNQDVVLIRCVGK